MRDLVDARKPHLEETSASTIHSEWSTQQLVTQEFAAGAEFVVVAVQAKALERLAGFPYLDASGVLERV